MDTNKNVIAPILIIFLLVFCPIFLNAEVFIQDKIKNSEGKVNLSLSENIIASSLINRTENEEDLGNLSQDKVAPKNNISKDEAANFMIEFMGLMYNESHSIKSDKKMIDLLSKTYLNKQLTNKSDILSVNCFVFEDFFITKYREPLIFVEILSYGGLYDWSRIISFKLVVEENDIKVIPHQDAIYSSREDRPYDYSGEYNLGYTIGNNGKFISPWWEVGEITRGNTVLPLEAPGDFAGIQEWLKWRITAPIMPPSGAEAEKCKPKGSIKYSNEELIDAVKKEDLQEITRIFKEDWVDINFRDKFGRTALHYSTIKGNINIAQELLNNGSDTNIVDNDGLPPLFTTIFFQHGMYDMVQILVRNNADINYLTDTKETGLMYAAMEGYVDIVDFMIENGADISKKNNKGLYAQDFAKDYDQKLVVDFFSNGSIPLSIEALNCVSETGNIDEIQRQIMGGVDVNGRTKYGLQPIITASKYGRNDAAKVLIEKGANVNAKNFGKGSEKMNTPLHYAAIENIALVKLLIESGSKINAKNKNLETPLHIAAKHNNAEIVKLLIENGAKANIENKKGETPLSLALAGMGEGDSKAFQIIKKEVDNEKDL